MITSASTANQLLEMLDSTSVVWAFLHGERRLAQDELTSDLDLIVDRHPLMVIHELIPIAASEDLHPVILWNYDPWSWTTVWIRPADLDVVQLDLTFDIRGGNKYGVRTDRFLAEAKRGVRWPEVASHDRLVYMLSKRLQKGQTAASAELRNAVNLDPNANDRIAYLLSPGRAKVVLKFLETGFEPRRTRRPALQARRFVERLRVPAGKWIAVALSDRHDSKVLSEFADLFRGKVPHLAVASDNLFGSIESQARRLQPGIVISRSSRWTRKADVHISSDGDALLIRGSREAIRLMGEATGSRVRALLGH